MRRKPLQGTKAQHRGAADAEMQTARRKMEAALAAIKEGRCTRAYMNIAEMWESLGRSDANGKWAGSTAWLPISEVQELGYQFTTHCLRDRPRRRSG